MPRSRDRVRAEIRFSATVVALVAISFGAALLTQPSHSQAGARAAPAASLYTTHCAGCHQPDGEGIEGTFPPLAGNEAATDSAYVATVITDGRTGAIEVLGVTYDSAMPAVAGLTDDEVDALSGFVVELAGGDAAPDEATPDEATPDETAPDEPPAPVEAPSAGEVDSGRDLFTGSDRLHSGGSSCASCHTAGDVGNLGGSSLGPDLTGVYAQFGGEAGTSAWLANPASPTMIPIFEDKPLTDDEIADLVAFLADAPAQDKPSYDVDWLPIAGLAGFALLIGGMAIAWRGMRRTYVQTLRSRG